jgi:hypothetical protein
MRSSLSKRAGLASLLLSILMLVFAQPAWGQGHGSPLGPYPIWATINSNAQGNYPGGNELFTVFVVNSASTSMTDTIDNATLTAPWPGGVYYGIGLPTILKQGQGVTLTIYAQIPSNFTQPNFTANLLIHATLGNSTTSQNVTLTGTAVVNIFALSSSQSSQTTTQPTSSSGTVSTNTFYLAVAVPSIIAVIFLALFAQARSKRPGP